MIILKTEKEDIIQSLAHIVFSFFFFFGLNDNHLFLIVLESESKIKAL